MKKINFLLLFTFTTSISFFALITKVNAQSPVSHVFFVNTEYSVSGMDSTSRAERNAILKEYHEKVTMKNELILKVSTMTHFFSDDSREFVTIYEFAKWEDINKAFDKDAELEIKAWPDPKVRGDFMKKMNSYFTHHKDAIYSELPAIKK
jgi:hypothetical protein